MPKRGDALWAEMEAKWVLHGAQRAAAAALLKAALIISVEARGRETFLMLHPSTVIPNGWQVSLFGLDGPFTHYEGQDQDAVIADALEHRDLSAVRPVTEQEFMAISLSPEFQEGTLRAMYTGLSNRISYEFGYDAARPYLDDAYGAASLDDAIQILQIGIRTLSKRRGTKKRKRR